MHILGLSAAEHDPAAALLSDGDIGAALEEQKLIRSAAHGLPRAAIQYCFSRTGTNWDNVEFVALASRPFLRWKRKSTYYARHLFSPANAAYYLAKELGVLSRELNNRRALQEISEASACKVFQFEHHLCHAAAAFYGSPFDQALILTLDSEGDGCCGMIAVGSDSRMRIVRRIPFPHSLAWVYSQITALLGFIPRREEHKVQWLSLDGDPTLEGLFLEMLRRRPGGVPSLDPTYFRWGSEPGSSLSPKFYERAGLPRPNGKQINDDARRVIASSLQKACATVVGDLIDEYYKQEGLDSICLGGGLFENTVLVADLEKRFGKKLFVPPAPGNAGCALGAAYLVWHQLLHKPHKHSISSVYWGPRYSRQEIKDVLDNCKATYANSYTEMEKVDAAVQLLQAGKIVGWYQGATEFGSRALGNRSLLGSPWAAYVKENINDFVKHREWFRPFALAIPEEDCADFFECSTLPRFMTSLGWARPKGDETLNGFLLPGGRVRLHVVSREANPLFWRLLKRFGEFAPAPILVNTSFNLFGEPLVVSPRDAIRSFYCSGIDALIIDNFLLRKHNDVQVIAPVAQPRALRAAQ